MKIRDGYGGRGISETRWTGNKKQNHESGIFRVLSEMPKGLQGIKSWEDTGISHLVGPLYTAISGFMFNRLGMSINNIFSDDAALHTMRGFRFVDELKKTATQGISVTLSTRQDAKAREEKLGHLGRCLSIVNDTVILFVENEDSLYFLKEEENKALILKNATPVTSALPLTSQNTVASVGSMVKIPGGVYRIGNTFFPKEGSQNETPVCSVFLSPFQIGVYPVTRGEYEAFVEGDGYKNKRYWTHEGWEEKKYNNWEAPEFWNESRFEGPFQPVVGVSFHEAVAYCSWKNAIENPLVYGYRIPTETEWEAAARGGHDGWRYPNGNKFHRDKTLFGNGGNANPLSVFVMKNPNDFGLCDLGNVWEWTSDRFHENYYEMLKEAETPINPFSEDFFNTEKSLLHTIRGGSYSEREEASFRVSNRYVSSNFGRKKDLGFRIAWNLPPQEE